MGNWEKLTYFMLWLQARLPEIKAPAFFTLSTRDLCWLATLLTIIALAYAPLREETGTYGVDSGIYLAGAQGLVEGKGYCYSYHLNTPKIGFYPPLQSVWLSVWWRIGGDFPRNVPSLNTGMFVLGLSTSAIVFLLWRRCGLPRELAAMLVLIWAFCPMWIGWLSLLMSDPGFTAVCLLAALIWAIPRPLPSNVAWALTGIVFAFAYLWRAAALAPMAALGIVSALQIRRGVWRPALVYGLPSIGSILVWKLFSPQTAGYEDVLSRYISMFGGVSGYVRLLCDNLFYCLKGIPFWEMMVPTLARVPSWLHFGDLSRNLYEIGTGVVFWALALLAVRGFRRQANAFDWAVVAAGVAYVGQVLVMPFPAGHFQRYFFVLHPFFVIWIWRGVADSRSLWLRRALCGLVVGTLATNAILSVVVFRRDRDQRLVAEFGELTAWTQANLPREAKAALNITLPVAHWFNQTKRPIVVDYFDSKWLEGSPITHAAQGFPRTDYVVMEAIDPRAEEMPDLFSEVFRTSNGNYRMLKINPEGQERFRKARNIPEPSQPPHSPPTR